MNLKAEVTTKIDGNVATLSYTGKDYVENAPVDEKTLKEIEKYNNGYIAAAVETGTEAAKDLLKENKQVEKVIFTAPYTTAAKGNVSVAVDRKKEISAFGKTVTKSVVKVSVKNPSNQMSKSRISALEKDLTETLLG